MRIKLEITIDTNDYLIDDKDPVQIDWLLNEVLRGTIQIYSEVIGDNIGEISKVTVLDHTPLESPQ